MLVRMWQNVKFTSFFYVDEKFTHQVIYFNTKSSIFYVKVKIYTSSLLHCYQLPMFFNESTYLLIKFLALISSFLYLYGVQFFPCLHNFVEVIKNICQVHSFINQEGLVMTRLKELGRSGNHALWNSTWPWPAMNFLTTWRNFLKPFCLCSTKAAHVWNYETGIKRSSYRKD